MPRELSKTVLPAYTIEPPDILIVEAISLVPKAPYKLKIQDVLSIQAPGALPTAPIGGPYAIEPGGVVNLGFPYGTVPVTGMTVEEAKEAIEQHLAEHLTDPLATVALLQTTGTQPIAGEHLVGPDGTINLGTYGSVFVVGMTIEQAKGAIERHLTQFLDSPEVTVDVFAYNSKVYYIVTEGAGLGDTVTRFPITGNETVLDAISNINGLTQVSSKRIWIARPSPYAEEVQILPVDWKSITSVASTSTNYQLMPGDRLFIAENELIALDTALGQLFAPVERVSGFILLGVGTASRLSGKILQGGGTRGSGFGTAF